MRDILLAVCGLTPQVVTETLWALNRRTPPIYPVEIWILTTERGREICQRTLLGQNGALARYAREYRLGQKRPRCTPEMIVLLRKAGGALLEDVRTDDDNQAIADQTAEVVRRQTERRETRLHCSVAGGRKTMGILLASALQLYGRPEDRLYHVLIPPAFESLDTFFYPPARPTKLTGKNGRSVNTATASIELAEIPYVRLRGLLSPAHLKRSAPFGSLLEFAEQRLRLILDPDPVGVDPAGNRLLIGRKVVRLPPAGMTLYHALAKTKLQHCTRPDLKTCDDCTDCFVPFTKDTWDKTKAVLEARGGGRILPAVKGPEDAPEQFRSLVSKLNKTLDSAVHVSCGENPYRVRSTGRKGETAYGLALDKCKLAERSD
jgi:CRISPR-associated protein (TIGR02584 family)